MKLSQLDKDRQALGLEAKGFLDSNLFKATQQHLSRKLEEEYPKPEKKGWEDKYRYAYAFSEVAMEVVKFWMGLKSEYERLSELENKEINNEFESEETVEATI